MEWSDRAIVLSTRRYGEGGAILRALAEEHGLYAGFVRGGASRRLRGVLEPGNVVRATWRARTAEQLGNFAVEPLEANAALVIEDGDRLTALSALAAVTAAALPERMASPEIYAALATTIAAVADGRSPVEEWGAAVVRFELGLLAELGFGLDLSRCAATGVRDDLVYVSPKSARAVSAGAGAPYRDRLLKLPQFLLTNSGEGRLEELVAGLELTGHFLDHHVFAPHQADVPEARRRLAARFARAARRTGA